MGKPIVYGPRYSVYTRAVIMALIEKKVAYDQVHIEMDDNAHRAPEHLKRHPFGMLPAFEHNGFEMAEVAVNQTACHVAGNWRKPVSADRRAIRLEREVPHAVGL